MATQDEKFILYKDLKKVIEEIKAKFYNPGVMLNKFFPKNSVVITYENKNPSTYIGGTWQLIGQGRALMGYDPSQTEFNSAGKTGGGKKSIAKIMVGWNNSEGNYLALKQDGSSWTDNLSIPNFNTFNNTSKGRYNGVEVVTTKDSGGLNTNSLPPYEVVFYWRRIDDGILVMDFKQLTFNSEDFTENNNVISLKSSGGSGVEVNEWVPTISSTYDVSLISSNCKKIKMGGKLFVTGIIEMRIRNISLSGGWNSDRFSITNLNASSFVSVSAPILYGDYWPVTCYTNKDSNNFAILSTDARTISTGRLLLQLPMIEVAS